MDKIFIKNYLGVLKKAKAIQGISARHLAEKIKKPMSEDYYKIGTINATFRGEKRTPYLIFKIAILLGVSEEILLKVE